MLDSCEREFCVLGWLQDSALSIHDDRLQESAFGFNVLECRIDSVGRLTWVVWK